MSIAVALHLLLVVGVLASGVFDRKVEATTILEVQLLRPRAVSGLGSPSIEGQALRGSLGLKPAKAPGRRAAQTATGTQNPGVPSSKSGDGSVASRSRAARDSIDAPVESVETEQPAPRSEAAESIAASETATTLADALAAASEAGQNHDASNETGGVQWGALVVERVRRFAEFPAGTSKDLHCSLVIEQLPGGQVVAATVHGSCGDPDIDRAVEIAALRASPLPAPPAGSEFQGLVELEFCRSARDC